MLDTTCDKCGSQVEARAVIASNGIKHYRGFCIRNCTPSPVVQAIKHSLLNERQKDRLPIHKDHREGHTYNVCEVCGALSDVEFHHIMPSAFNFSKDNWGCVGVFLCREHHEEWHDIVTWYMNPLTPNKQLRKEVMKAFLGNIKKVYK
jgi:hypothetical protein